MKSTDTATMNACHQIFYPGNERRSSIRFNCVTHTCYTSSNSCCDASLICGFSLRSMHARLQANREHRWREHPEEQLEEDSMLCRWWPEPVPTNMRKMNSVVWTPIKSGVDYYLFGEKAQCSFQCSRKCTGQRAPSQRPDGLKLCRSKSKSTKNIEQHSCAVSFCLCRWCRWQAAQHKEVSDFIFVELSHLKGIISPEGEQKGNRRAMQRTEVRVLIVI